MAEYPGAGSKRSSLERLKALDSLPDLSTQLREANQLCNHSARAEMISKWLLGKLKSEAEARGSADAWDTLLSAFRLLSPLKVAALLSTQDLLGTCKSTLEPLTNGQRTGVFLAFVRILNFLFEIVAGPEGTQLKAVLSVSPYQAASFLDIWMDSTLTLVGIALFENGLAHDMLHPIFEIWNMRKRSADENETFAKHCFLSASRLLPLVNHYKDHRKLKRRRADDAWSPSYYKQMLESMLARHIFVLARTAFFKAQNAAETKARRQVGSQDPTFVLRSMLKPLHNDDSNNTGLDAGQLAVLTDLFSVVVRCVPRITPQQRTKEKLWLDAVFQALSECMRTLNSNSIGVRDALRDMLSIAKDRQVVLSKDILEDVIKRHSGLTSGETIDWKIIALVLQIDSDVFSDEKMATILLTEITTTTTDQPKNITQPQVEAVSSGKKLMDFLRKQVIVPVMKTFADQRKLGTFVDMWAAQITHNNYEMPVLIWADLAADFALLLEASLTDNQVLALFDQYYTPIKAAADTQLRYDDMDLATLPTLKSSITILDAILSGVRSEPLSDALLERCGELFKLMLGAEFDSSVRVGEVNPLTFPLASQSWSLITKAFELWFPAWAIAQSDAEPVAEMGARVVRSKTYNIASFRPGRGENTVRAANGFVACVCAHLHKYDQVDVQDVYGHGMPRRGCLESIELNFATGVPHESTWPILLQFPSLIADFSGDETINLIEDCIRNASQSATEALQALTSYIFQHTDSKKVNDLVETFVLYLSHEKRPEAGGESEDDEHIVESLCDGYEIATLRAASGLSPDFISRPHREKILNAVCERQHAEPHPTWPQTEAAQKWRIVVLTALMKVPNATCKLAVDPEELLRLTKSVMQHDPDENLVPMIVELTVRLSADLLATQDQERSRSMLIGFAEAIIMDFIREARKWPRQVDDGYDATLTVFTTLINRLEAGAKDELKSKFSYRNQETINSFITVCLYNITSRIRPGLDDCSVQDGRIHPDLRAALTALLALPEDLLQFAQIDTDSWHEPLLELMETCFTALGNETKRDHDDRNAKFHASTMRDIVVDVFHWACNISTSVPGFDYTAIARNVAQLHLTPVKRESFMTTFGHYVQMLEGEQFVELLNALLSILSIELDTTLSLLPLVEVCVSSLDKVKLEAIESPLPKLLSQLLSLAELDPNIVVRKRAMTCIASALKGNASLVNQYCIEMVLATAKRVLSAVSRGQKIYLDTCNVLSILLLQYRSRLHGRFHLVSPVVQSLLSALFQPSDPNSSADEKDSKLKTKHAQAVAKLLTLLCEPPQFKRSSKTSELVDEARKEQAYVGKSVQYILHHYCNQILNGKLGPGMNETLTPGLWSMIEAMEMGEAEGVKTLSAAMNNSERAVLRGIYDDWRRFGKWRGA